MSPGSQPAISLYPVAQTCYTCRMLSTTIVVLVDCAGCGCHESLTCDTYFAPQQTKQTFALQMEELNSTTLHGQQLYGALHIYQTVANRKCVRHLSTPLSPTLYTHTHARPCTRATAATPLFTTVRDPPRGCQRRLRLSTQPHHRDSPRRIVHIGAGAAVRSAAAAVTAATDAATVASRMQHPFAAWLASAAPRQSLPFPQQLSHSSPPPQFRPTRVLLPPSSSPQAPIGQPHRSTPTPRKRAKTNAGSRVVGLVCRTIPTTRASLAPPPPPSTPPPPTPTPASTELPSAAPCIAAGRDGNGGACGTPPAQPPVTGSAETGSEVWGGRIAKACFPRTPIGMTSSGSSAGKAGGGRPGPRMQRPPRRKRGNKGMARGVCMNRAWEGGGASSRQPEGKKRGASGVLGARGRYRWNGSRQHRRAGQIGGGGRRRAGDTPGRARRSAAATTAPAEQAGHPA